MRIGIDIDEVLCETLDFVLTFFEGKIAGKPLTKEQVSDYYLPNIPGYESLSREDAASFFVYSLQSERTLTELKPIQGAYDRLKKGKASGHTFHAITARGEPLRPITEAWLGMHFPEIFEQLSFCNHYRDEYQTFTKEEICAQEGIKLFVEDNPNYAINLEKLGIKVFLLDKPWNQNFNLAQHPGIIKVKGQEEIYW